MPGPNEVRDLKSDSESSQSAIDTSLLGDLHALEQLVHLTFKEGDQVQGELTEALQIEKLRGKLVDQLPLLGGKWGQVYRYEREGTCEDLSFVSCKEQSWPGWTVSRCNTLPFSPYSPGPEFPEPS